MPATGDAADRGRVIDALIAVNASLSGKVTPQQLADGLSAKVNTATYTAGLAAKADTAAVNTALAGKLSGVKDSSGATLAAVDGVVTLPAIPAAPVQGVKTAAGATLTPDSAGIVTLPAAEKAPNSNLSSRLRSESLPAIPAVTSDAATVTVGTEKTLSAMLVSPQSSQMRVLGGPGWWDNSQGRLMTPTKTGVDVQLYGDALEAEIFPGSSQLDVWVWVDGSPSTAQPQRLAVTQYQPTYVKVAFSSAALRRVEVLMDYGSGAMYSLAVGQGSYLTAPPPRVRAAFVGDSFFAGSSSCPALSSSDMIASRILGVECVGSAQGGTGYVATGDPSWATPFSGPDRVAAVVNADPDVVVVKGSVNDDGSTGVEAAAAAYYATLAEQLPGVPVIVIGPPPTNATSTVSAARSENNRAVRRAAAAAPNVAGYIDLIGGSSASTDPVELTQYGTWQDGQFVWWRGQVFVVKNAGQTYQNGPWMPDNNGPFVAQTVAYSGTGSTAAPAGDGTRDVLLGADNVHPTAAGSMALGQYEASAIRSILAAL